MKTTIVSRTARLIDDLHNWVEAEGYVVAQSLLRKGNQPLETKLGHIDSDLLIVDSADDELKSDVTALSAITRDHPSLAVVLLCASRDAEALIAAMRAGIREVLPSPPSATEFAAALQRIAQRSPLACNDAGRVIAFISCKGGSGATLIATNFAYLLATDCHKKTAFIDLDLQYGDASYFVTDRTCKSNIADLTRKIDRIDAKLLAACMVNVAPNFSLLPAPEEPEAAIGITAQQIERVVDVARQNYDFVIIDFERTLDAVTIKALDKAELVFLVMENMVPFVRDARRLVRSFRSLGYPDSKLRLIVNRYEKNDAIDLKQLEKAVGLPVAHTIRNSFEDVAQAVNNGVPLVKINSNNLVVRKLRELACELAGVPVPNGHGWIDRLIGEHY